jgi:hypothetical protein
VIGPALLSSRKYFAVGDFVIFGFGGTVKEVAVVPRGGSVIEMPVDPNVPVSVPGAELPVCLKELTSMESMEVEVEMLPEVMDPFLREETKDCSPSASDAEPS